MVTIELKTRQIETEGLEIKACMTSLSDTCSLKLLQFFLVNPLLFG